MADNFYYGNGVELKLQGATSAGTPIESPVAQASRELANRLTELEDLVQELKKRLAPVLSQSVPACNELACGGSSGCAVVEDFRSASSRVASMREWVADITNRLEI